MSAYFFGLYFSEKVSRQNLQHQILQIPKATEGPEGPDHFWVGGVHLVFHTHGRFRGAESGDSQLHSGETPVPVRHNRNVDGGIGPEFRLQMGGCFPPPIVL